jgi:hypothetical protein
MSDDDLARAAANYCMNKVGTVVERGQWCNDTLNADGHAINLGMINWSSDSFLWNEDYCQEAYKALMFGNTTVLGCSDGSGSQGGYVWYPYRLNTWFLGVDSNVPDQFCLGGCGK